MGHQEAECRTRTRMDQKKALQLRGSLSGQAHLHLASHSANPFVAVAAMKLSGIRTTCKPTLLLMCQCSPTSEQARNTVLGPQSLQGFSTSKLGISCLVQEASSEFRAWSTVFAVRKTKEFSVFDLRKTCKANLNYTLFGRRQVTMRNATSN